MNCVSAASLYGAMPKGELFASRPIDPVTLAGQVKFAGKNPEASAGRRVLIVSDDAIIALDLQRILRDAGYRVVGPISSVSQIGAFANRARLDCAILDIDRWPNRAFAIADYLAVLNIPLVVVTARGRAAVPQRYTQLPVVQKPYAKNSLLDGIEQAICGCPNERPEPHVFEDDGKIRWPRVLPGL